MNYLLIFGPAVLLIAINAICIRWLRLQYTTFLNVVFASRQLKRHAKILNFGAMQFNKMSFSAKQATRALENFRKAFDDFDSYASYVAEKSRPQVPPK